MKKILNCEMKFLLMLFKSRMRMKKKIFVFALMLMAVGMSLTVVSCSSNEENETSKLITIREVQSEVGVVYFDESVGKWYIVYKTVQLILQLCISPFKLKRMLRILVLTLDSQERFTSQISPRRCLQEQVITLLILIVLK